MTSICKPQTFFSTSNPFISMEVGCLGGIWRAGMLRGTREGWDNCPPRDCDNPQRLPTIRDGGFIGTPNAIVTVRTQSRRSLSRSTAE